MGGAQFQLKVYKHLIRLVNLNETIKLQNTNHLCKNNTEMDAFLHFHNERMHTHSIQNNSKNIIVVFSSVQ